MSSGRGANSGRFRLIGRSYVTGHFQIEAGHARDTARAGHQAHFTHAEITQNLRTDAIDARIPLGCRALRLHRLGQGAHDILLALLTSHEHDDAGLALR